MTHNMGTINMSIYDKPLATSGLHSFRYRGRYGWIMIGAHDALDALREAARSTDNVTIAKLQEWDGEKYVSIVREG
jgi:hypothetical protein